MNKYFVLSILLISLLVTFQNMLPAYATTFSRQFKEATHSYSSTDKRFSFQVTATIETEPDGNWFFDNTYQANWTIRITYVNESLYDINNFSMVCSDPKNPFSPAVEQRAITYQTIVTAQKNGVLSMTFTPKHGQNYELDVSFGLVDYYNGKIITSGSWFPSMYDEPIVITLENNKTTEPSIISGATLSIEPLWVAIIGIVLVTIILTGVIAYRIGKNQQKFTS